MYNATQVATLFNVARETVRQWSIEFAQDLSPTANPGNGRQRIYTDSDIEIFALIDELKEHGKLYAEIHLALANGQRGTPPQMGSAIIQVDSNRGLTIEQLKSDLATAQDEVKESRGQIKLLTAQLESERQRSDRLLTENALLRAGRKPD